MNWTKAFRRQRPAMPDTLLIEGREVPIAIRRHVGARRITMRISPCGAFLKLTVPPHVGSQTVATFLERHRGWAQERLAKAGGVLSIGDGATIPFRGGPLLLRRGTGRGTALSPGEDEGPTLHVGGAPEHFRRRVKDFVRREARRDLEAAVARHAKAVGIRPAGIALKDTVSRWGSCSSERKLSFSFRIVLAPPAILDYLAAHECAHLREMNHGSDFWALCHRLCPDTDAARLWLREHGASLHAIDFG